jgi:Haem-degrading
MVNSTEILRSFVDMQTLALRSHLSGRCSPLMLGDGCANCVGGRDGGPPPATFLYAATQPGGSLYGLSDSNPVAAAGAYGDRIDTGTGAYIGPLDTTTYGTATDPMVGQVIGGINVFGGGLALYDGSRRVGGVGVSGDTSCTDHMVAWHLRHHLVLDLLATEGINGPASLFAGDTNHPDNIIWDITPNPNGGTGISTSGFGHPTCLNNPVINPTTHTPTSLPPVR